MGKLRLYWLNIKVWFKANSANLAFLLIVVSMVVGAWGLYRTQLELTQTQNHLLKIAKQHELADTLRDKSVGSINEETRRIGILICAIVRQQGDTLTDEERREIRQLCEVELSQPPRSSSSKPSPNNINSQSTGGGTEPVAQSETQKKRHEPPRKPTNPGRPLIPGRRW